MSTELQDKKILSVPVPRAMDAFIQERLVSQGFQTVSEYVRSLIRADQEHATRQQVEAKLLKAMDRGDYREVTPELWERLAGIAQGKTERTSPRGKS